MRAPSLDNPLAGAPAPRGRREGLRRRQCAFAQALLDPDAAVPPDLVGPDGQPSSTRFAVYRNNVISGLIDALKAAFPTICALVGDAFFAAMARAYARAEPPTSPVMLEYGAGFPAFIASFDDAATLPYLSDVARLEWAWTEAYHAGEALPLSPATLARMLREDMARVRLLLHPSTRIVRSDFPVVALWRIHVDSPGDEEINLDRGEDALVSRAAAHVEVRRLPPGAAAFLEALIAGTPIVKAMQLGSTADARFDLSTALGGMMESEIIIGFETGARPNRYGR